MTDRRFLAANGRVALAGLAVEAERFTGGEPRRAARSLWLRRAPGGAVDRQLLFGDAFRLLEERDGWAFGIREKDGYVGYLEAAGLWEGPAPTHGVAVRSTWAWAAPEFKSPPLHDLHLSAQVALLSETAPWAEIAAPGGSAFVPLTHLAPLGAAGDPVAEARKMTGTPYVWAGNTGFGIDCSGLVQVAYHAAGRECPPDSDLQRGIAGEALADGAALQRGDLVFWTGHVALATGPDELLHANAHHMAVAAEPYEAAVARIARTDTGLPLLRRRPAS